MVSQKLIRPNLNETVIVAPDGRPWYDIIRLFLEKKRKNKNKDLEARMTGESFFLFPFKSISDQFFVKIWSPFCDRKCWNIMILALSQFEQVIFL